MNALKLKYLPLEIVLDSEVEESPLLLLLAGFTIVVGGGFTTPPFCNAPF